MSLKQFICNDCQVAKIRNDCRQLLLLVFLCYEVKKIKTILIVDDSSFMRMILKLLVEKNGYKVIGEAANGAIGVKKYNELKPDIITLDITMPIMNGVDALKQIMSEDPDSKAIMVSAMGQESFVRQCSELGAKYFIVKPFKEDQVIKILNQISS